LAGGLENRAPDVTVWGDFAPIADHHAEWNVNEGIVPTANQHVCLSSHTCVNRAFS
jgi:hypothetical protein